MLLEKQLDTLMDLHFKFEYVLLVPVKGKEIKITFDDWIFKQDDRVAINRATMTKFGYQSC